MAPLLIESGATERVDEVWVVTVKPDVQYERLMARDQCSREQAEKIIAAQMPLEEKERFGTVLIDNSNSLDETRRQVIEAWQQRIAS
jgi:dephospho-CoA kinase